MFRHTKDDTFAEITKSKAFLLVSTLISQARGALDSILLS